MRRKKDSEFYNTRVAFLAQSQTLISVRTFLLSWQFLQSLKNVAPKEVSINYREVPLHLGLGVLKFLIGFEIHLASFQLRIMFLRSSEDLRGLLLETVRILPC